MDAMFEEMAAAKVRAEKGTGEPFEYKGWTDPMNFIPIASNNSSMRDPILYIFYLFEQSDNTPASVVRGVLKMVDSTPGANEVGIRLLPVGGAPAGSSAAKGAKRGRETAAEDLVEAYKEGAKANERGLQALAQAILAPPAPDEVAAREVAARNANRAALHSEVKDTFELLTKAEDRLDAKPGDQALTERVARLKAHYDAALAAYEAARSQS